MKSINDQLYGFSYELNHTTEEDLTTCFAIDTGTVFVAYGGVWYEQPTRWAEQSGSGGGGGGGGGWKTISVKFVNTNPGGAPNEYIVENLYHLENNVLSNSGVRVPAEGDVTLDVLAYGDGVSFSLQNFDNIDGSVEPTGTGGVSIDLQNVTITITGEGTFTAAGKDIQ